MIGLVLAGVATTARRDLQWLYCDVGNLFPEAHAEFCALVPDAQDTWTRIEAYAALLSADSAATVQQAADNWCKWELAILGENFDSAGAPWSEPVFRRTFARIVTHFFRHFCWLEDGQVLDQVSRISRIPGVMIHSRFDPSAPLRAPWELSQHWPAARLETLPGRDHAALSEVMRNTHPPRDGRFENRPLKR